MFLNTIQPAEGAKHSSRRVGRGIGSGLGKTCGRGHKGQKSRSGGFHKVGFEGGQMPLQRRLPKRGFRSLTALVTAAVHLTELNSLSSDVVDLFSLKQVGIVSDKVKFVKIISSGSIERAVVLKGIKATKGAKIAIEAAGGRIEE